MLYEAHLVRQNFASLKQSVCCGREEFVLCSQLGNWSLSLTRENQKDYANAFYVATTRALSWVLLGRLLALNLLAG